ncbi:MAG: flagellar export protein FliJ [Hyphomicrobiaceae bacterium]|nr:flagellar export protein FliJ [Hyphomicrobiaceae bacterium]
MNGREAALRAKRFEADESAKKIDHLDMMIRDFEALALDLDRQVQAEEERTGIKDTGHFGYSTFAKSAAQRRDNLRASANELRVKLEVLVKDRGDVVLELAQTDVARETRTTRRRPFRTAQAAVAR